VVVQPLSLRALFGRYPHRPASASKNSVIDCSLVSFDQRLPCLLDQKRPAPQRPTATVSDSKSLARAGLRDHVFAVL